MPDKSSADMRPVIASRVLGSAPHGDPFLHKYGRRLYSLVVSLLSGLYPALRAATMVPVQALKYE